MTTPTEPARAAAFRAIVRRATAQSELWGNQVYPDLAPAKVLRPYLIYYHAGGGEANARVIPDADILIGIKGVADTMSEASIMSGRISALFNDADLATGLLSPGSEWNILSVTQMRDVYMVETVNASKQIYHDGAMFRFYLESI